MTPENPILEPPISEPSSYGSLISVLLVVVVLVAGAWYVWKQRTHQIPPPSTTVNVQVTQ